MKKFIVLILILAFLMISFGCTTIASNEPAGPAPNAGDGLSDGSGLNNEPSGVGVTPGPAPNSGDGDPDGSGF